MFFLATCDQRGLPTCSYKGGDPGFVRVRDAHRLAFPNHDGNGKYHSMGNRNKNPNVGMLFVDFEGQRRLRWQGTAMILDNDSPVLPHPESARILADTGAGRFRVGMRSKYDPVTRLGPRAGKGSRGPLRS